jgi:hypothetical protein
MKEEVERLDVDFLSHNQEQQQDLKLRGLGIR